MSKIALTLAHASQFAAIALGHVGREYPNKLDHVLTVPDDLQGPRALHPLFYGSFDWHSCVHSYWLLARIHRRFPSAEVAAHFDAALTAENVAGELAYLARPSARGFERPYGWAWLLYLAAELARHETDEGRRWCAALKPLAEAFADRFIAFLPKADYPVRAGAHGNTAFALTLAWDYARTCKNLHLAALIEGRGRLWYGADEACQAWEPSGDDFLSPALSEAQLMQAILPPAEFATWFAAFLPGLSEGRPATLFAPAGVSDRSDGKIAHLDGLNLSRAWAWRGLATVLTGAARDRALAAAEAHLAASLPHLCSDYMGEHWLATYALLALDAE
jgi:hypothetical protein